MSVAVQGGFDTSSGGNQKSGQKGQQEPDKIPSNTVPLNCFMINQLRDGAYGGSHPFAYDLDGVFELAQITARYQYIGDQGQSKVSGLLSDSTGSVEVVTPKQRDSDEIPAFIQNFNKNFGSNSGYVRAVLRLRKKQPAVLLNFTIITDFNEITRHNLDIALRHMQRNVGIIPFPHTEKQNTAAAAVPGQQPSIIIDASLHPQVQIVQFFKAVIKQQGSNNIQISKDQIVAFFKDRFQIPQITNYLQQLIKDESIFSIAGTNSYFLNLQ